MNKNTDDMPVFNKIEIDENSEPIIVEVAAENIPTEEKKIVDEKKARKDKIKKAGKQLVMKQILGFNDDESINKRQKIFKNVCSILFIILIVAVLAFTAYKDFFANEQGPPDWNVIFDILAHHWFFGFIAVLMLLLNYFFKGFKLTAMCKSMTGKWHFLTCMQTAVIGHYYNNVTPLAVGGQPFEIYHLSKHGVRGGVATSLPISAYFLNQICFSLLGLVALLLYRNGNVLSLPASTIEGIPSIITVSSIIGLILGILAPSVVIVFSVMPRFCSVLVHFVINLGGKMRLIKRPRETTYKTLKTVMHNSKCIKKLAASPFTLVVTTLASLLETITLVSIAYFTLKFFGYDSQEEFLIMEWLQICQLGMILYLAISFIPTPGNSGAADFSFFFIFQTGLAAGLAFPAMMIWRLLAYYSFIIIGFIFINIKKQSDKNHL